MLKYSVVVLSNYCISLDRARIVECIVRWLKC